MLLFKLSSALPPTHSHSFWVGEVGVEGQENHGMAWQMAMYSVHAIGLSILHNLAGNFQGASFHVELEKAFITATQSKGSVRYMLILII